MRERHPLLPNLPVMSRPSAYHLLSSSALRSLSRTGNSQDYLSQAPPLSANLPAPAAAPATLLLLLLLLLRLFAWGLRLPLTPLPWPKG